MVKGICAGHLSFYYKNLNLELSFWKACGLRKENENILLIDSKKTMQLSFLITGWKIEKSSMLNTNLKPPPCVDVN